MPFNPVDPRQSFPELEKGILRYWQEEDIFKRSIHQRSRPHGDPLNGTTKPTKEDTFSFYDGPPFATGLPHYGHLLAGTIKDVIPRYQTMRGKRVERRFGWDCHGLPVEYEIEKEHNLKSKRDIEAMGVKKFNDLCRGIVQRYTKEWRQTVERIGRFVDMDNDYKTMDPDYMESILWVFKNLHDKKLIYEGHKPMHICPRCATALSNFEVTQGYKDVTDLAATVMFELIDQPKTFILAWTTTPWTLPGNLFLAVNTKIQYVKFEKDGNTFICSKEFAERQKIAETGNIVDAQVPATSLVGLTYTPLFPYFKDQYKETAFKIVEGEFVTADEGTGIVHIAPGFGTDDFEVGKKEKVPVLQHVSMDGRMIPAVTDFAGLDVKPKDEPSKTDKLVIQKLKEQGSLFSSESITHSYPHCWRCDSPLLNYATSSWFVEVEKIKNKMIATNKKTEWVPEHLRDGRFGKWLEGARDWAISRNRYWGTPLPIWRTPEGKMEVLGSRDDIWEKKKIRLTKITTVRHGESEGNVNPRYQGELPGTDLTKNGIAQAKETAKFLKDQNVTKIYCSPLARTQQTAEIIAKATGAEVIIDERLRETQFGEYEGKTIDFSDMKIVRERRAKKLDSGSVESIYHFPGMESWESVQARVKSFAEDILPQCRSEHIVVVTHADPIQNFIHFFTKEEPLKISHRPYPTYAEPKTFFWDHDTQEQLDLHKETLDFWSYPGEKTDQSVQLTMVRHGETQYNKEKRLQGWDIDPELTELGHEQAQETAKKISKKSFDVLLCSPSKRARQTAEHIAKELKMEIVEWPELKERNFEGFTGKHIPELLAEYPFPFANEHVALHYVTPPKGESMSQFMQRAEQVQKRILKEFPGKKVLIVSHGGMVQAMSVLTKNLTVKEGTDVAPSNAFATELSINPLFTRIPDVLDCWFESGAMPYAQSHFPFKDSMEKDPEKGMPPNFPADFIAEGIDQTRGWFYTLTVLSSALFNSPAFKHCVVNGTVLASDGKKMSKRLKNYPEPMLIVDKYGADAVRFALMNSPAVRAEDLRFSENLVEEALRSILLPLWNAYAFFVTYANAADFTVDPARKPSEHVLDRWILTEVQDLTNRMTAELEAYRLSSTCSELFESVDALTNWYVRLSRRRFAGKDCTADERLDALHTLHKTLVNITKLLAPFCPFIADAIYQNLEPQPHGSVHLADWPEVKKLTKEDEFLLSRQRLLRHTVSLGMSLRSHAKIKLRQPLRFAHISIAPKLLVGKNLEKDEIALLSEEMNVQKLTVDSDASGFAKAILQIDARKVGPRVGGKVQELIREAKAGNFSEEKDGFTVLGEKLSLDEASLHYIPLDETKTVAGDKGVVIELDTEITEELKMQGLAYDVIRAVQQARKDDGFSAADKIILSISGIDDVLNVMKDVIEMETNATLGKSDSETHKLELDDVTVSFAFHRS